MRKVFECQTAARVAFMVLSVCLWPTIAIAGGTPDPGNQPLLADGGDADSLPDNENQLLNLVGPDRGFDSGDYVGDATSGLQRAPSEPDRDGYYYFGIEVPPSQSALRVELFDADIGAGDLAGTENHDQNNENSWESSVIYELIDPAGVSTAVIQLGPQDCDPVTPGMQASCDNTWSSLGTFQINNPDPGHWTFRARMPSSGIADDNNGFGLRAHDGDATAAGVEYNVYASSYLALGHLYGPSTAAPGYSRSHDLYPYVTRDCEFDFHEFDGDDDGDESATLTPPRNPALAEFYDLFSGNAEWRTIIVLIFRGSANSPDYGLWDLRWVTGAFNLFSFWMGDPTAENVQNPAGNGASPDTNPVAGALRLYLPADGSRFFGERGGADDVAIRPKKPWVQESYSVISGAAPPLAGQPSRLRVVITINNPSGLPIQFDSTTGGDRVVTTKLPDNFGVTTLVPGSVAISNPSAAAGSGIEVIGSGPWSITFAPGVVDPGTVALLTYDVDFLPPNLNFYDITDQTDPTMAIYTDESCASATGVSSLCSALALLQARQQFGPMCGLFVQVTAFDPLFADGFEEPE